jgi:uncharacterized protein YbjT (DUF2867 family)
MKILILGATGVFGKRISELLAKSYEVEGHKTQVSFEVAREAEA